MVRLGGGGMLVVREGNGEGGRCRELLDEGHGDRVGGWGGQGTGYSDRVGKWGS